MRRIQAILAAVALMAAAGPVDAQMRLRIDASQPLAVMEALAGRDASPETVERLAHMPGSVSLIRRHLPFGSDLTEENWRRSLTAALRGEPLADSYRFRTLIDRRDAIQASIDAITGDPAAFARDVEAITAPYTPAGQDREVSVVFVVGSPGSGWVEKAGEFHFDIGGAGGDIEGTKIFAAHEIYHLVLEDILPDPVMPDSEGVGRVERIVLHGMNEGMALHVGRFRADTGLLSRRNLGFEQTNMRRIGINFRLMDVFLLAAFHDPEVTHRDADRIVFSGVFNEPGYYVFREMAAAIEAKEGRARLLELISGRPSQFVLEYHRLAAPDAPRLSEATLLVVRYLDERAAAVEARPR